MHRPSDNGASDKQSPFRFERVHIFFFSALVHRQLHLTLSIILFISDAYEMGAVHRIVYFHIVHVFRYGSGNQIKDNFHSILVSLVLSILLLHFIRD